MRNIKLIVEYDGTDFCGWQVQNDVRTVQGELEAALEKLTRSFIRVTSAGRTDAGVHALGQVVNFKTDSNLPVHVFTVGLNPLLPRDVKVLDSSEVDEDFNSRYSAYYRSYRYHIIKRPLAIGRQYAWYLKDDIDILKMQEASSLIMGIHDFESFCQAGSDVKHYNCDVHKVLWHEKGDRIHFDIIANRFLHNMVRILVGTFINIGNGTLNQK